jgi:hypothetical protein
MKGYKLFYTSILVNFIFCSLIIYSFIVNSSLSVITKLEFESFPVFTVAAILILALFMLFDWYCYQMVRSIRSGYPLSDSSVNTAGNFKDASLLISVLILLAIAWKVLEEPFEVEPEFLNFRKYFLEYCAVLISITTIYLSITYSFMHKHQSKKISDSIDNIGIEE